MSRANGHVRLFAFGSAWFVALISAGGVLFHTGTTLFDARAYWLAWHGPLYANGFVYPPAGALLFLPAAFLPWTVFAVAWLAVLTTAGTWLLWPLPPYLVRNSKNRKGRPWIPTRS